ncbi:MAG: thioredoxin-disulfide reductase [Candidatus Absconditabacterales bacterium]|nr:thioredoxin-disulfide reductase [Candidatus Absconditabacterales bacterium]
MTNHRKLIIIGSGPAGHTAAIYAGRANLAPVMFEGFMAGGIAAGGQLTTTTTVENFPGFPGGIQGPELMRRMREQSIESGCTIITKTVDAIDTSVRPFVLTVGQETWTADAVIVATGATAKKLSVPGVDTYWMKGISGCAICDGALPMFRNKIIAVVGGGDVAMEEAIHMSHFGSKVLVLVRTDKLRASKAMQEKAFKNPKIEFLRHTEVQEVLGDGKKITGLRIINHQSAVVTDIEVGGLFFAIGHTPNTGFLKGQVQLDDAGYIVTQPGTTQTSVPGIFAAGDVQDKKYRQAITSAGTGCMAALEAERRLQNT